MLPQPTLSDQVSQLQSQLSQFNAQYQPFVAQPHPAPPIQERQEIRKVNGIAGAKEYQKNTLAPNSSAVVFDSEKDIFYVVMKDANGVSPELMNYATFTMHKEQAPESIYATKEDLSAFMAEIRTLVGGIKNEQPV